jgi:hypothetical protein
MLRDSNPQRALVAPGLATDFQHHPPCRMTEAMRVASVSLYNNGGEPCQPYARHLSTSSVNVICR